MSGAFSDYPAELRAAVDAYDESRRESHGSREASMSDANKATIAPMIMAAVRAYVEASIGEAETPSKRAAS